MQNYLRVDTWLPATRKVYAECLLPEICDVNLAIYYYMYIMIMCWCERVPEARATQNDNVNLS